MLLWFFDSCAATKRTLAAHQELTILFADKMAESFDLHTHTGTHTYTHVRTHTHSRLQVNRAVRLFSGGETGAQCVSACSAEHLIAVMNMRRW